MGNWGYNLTLYLIFGYHSTFWGTLENICYLLRLCETKHLCKHVLLVPNQSSAMETFSCFPYVYIMLETLGCVISTVNYWSAFEIKLFPR